jgi:hypothetical protein
LSCFPEYVGEIGRFVVKFGSLFEDQCEYSAVFVTSGQVKTTVVKTHYLTGDTQTYAGALLSCGVEWDEYLLLTFFADRTTVIDHVYDDMLGRGRGRNIRNSLH